LTKYAAINISVQDFTDQLVVEYGYPDLDPIWYGLWSPRFDCFVMVHWNLETLTEIQILTSSKIVTRIVELDKELYKKSIIDNYCCHNWTSVDPELTKFNSFYNRIPPKCQIVANNKDIDPELVEIQSWLNLCLYCINKLKLLPKIQLFVENLFDLPHHTDPKKQIYKILLLSQDFNTAKNQIQHILQNHV
jgi:hypothetical protein